MSSPVPKVLVANRGEIAVRILQAIRELGWISVAVYTRKDASHATFADEAVELDSVESYLDPKALTDQARHRRCTHIHPGYGFLSESTHFAALLSQESPSLIFIGPSVDVIRISSDKVLSRNLAISLGVPVAPGTHVSTSDDIRSFSRSHEGATYPLMIKALDGGGGRGIRMVQNEGEVEEAFKRCMGESPSRRLFVEKALTGAGWKHIEVQIVGDGTGEVVHLWERECSIQRRFQKIIEIAPSSLKVELVQPLIDASMRIAQELKYRGLGTFEFLLNAQSNEWVFLEINPRLQVEHTVTEEISGIDLVRAQLLLSQPNANLREVLPSLFPTPPRPRLHALQLRLTAEDPTKAFQLSTGVIKPSEVTWPTGPGVRVDTWLSLAPFRADIGSGAIPVVEVGTEFDSLLAKIIVRGESPDHVARRAIRALREVKLPSSIRTNLELLVGVVSHDDWKCGSVDTLWLKRNVEGSLQLGKSALTAPTFQIPSAVGRNTSDTGSSSSVQPSGAILLQPGTSFNLSLSPMPNQGEVQTSAPVTHNHTISISSLTFNAFPDELAGSLHSSFSPVPFNFSLTRSTTSSLASTSFESPDPQNPGHIHSPLAGKIVELHPSLLHVAEGKSAPIKKGEAVAVISVMKMESVIQSPVNGLVERLGRGVEVGVVIPEGMLLCVVDSKVLVGEVPVKSRL